MSNNNNNANQNSNKAKQMFIEQFPQQTNFIMGLLYNTLNYYWKGYMILLTMFIIFMVQLIITFICVFLIKTEKSKVGCCTIDYERITFTQIKPLLGPSFLSSFSSLAGIISDFLSFLIFKKVKIEQFFVSASFAIVLYLIVSLISCKCKTKHMPNVYN